MDKFTVKSLKNLKVMSERGFQTATIFQQVIKDYIYHREKQKVFSEL